MKYWLQTKAPAGNWSDSMGANELAALQSHADWLRKFRGETVRIVERADKEIES